MATHSLSSLRCRFIGWTDSLSEHLSEWIVDYVDQPSEEKIQKLQKEILVNPMDRAPLTHPVLDVRGTGGWVWEKWMLEEYLLLSSVSPFDQAPIEETPHLYGEEMIVWSQTSAPQAAMVQAATIESLALCLLGQGKPIYLEPSVIPLQDPAYCADAIAKWGSYLLLAKTSLSLLHEQRRGRQFSQMLKITTDMGRQLATLDAERIETRNNEQERRTALIRIVQAAEEALLQERLEHTKRRLRTTQDNIEIERKRSEGFQAEILNIQQAMANL